MNKLEPVLRYHFWILLFFGLVMSFTGWWMTTSKMMADTTARRAKIDEAKKKVQEQKDIPSKDWEDNLKAINVEQEKKNRASRDWLYARQKERMVWPEVLKEVAAKMNYRDEFKDAIHHINYRDHYMQEVKRVYEIPRPINEETGEGVVNFPMTVMPHRDWGDDPPTSQQMWDSMEDLWLLEPILQAILEINGGMDATRYDASITAIELLKLKGGDRSKIGQSADSGGGMGGGMMDRPGMGPAAGDAKGFAGAGGGLGGGGGNAVPIGNYSVDIKEVEELGDPGTEGAPGAAGAGATGLPGDRPAMMADAKGGAMMGAANGPVGDDVGRRYIDKDDALPYRTRGFTLTVVMDHRKIPDFYAQLTSSERSPWPIKILRMNIARLEDSAAGGAEGGGRAGGAMRDGGLFGGGKAAATPARPAMPTRGMRELEGGPRGAQLGQAAEEMDTSYLARVALVGLITLYNEPPKPEQSSTEGTPAAPTQPGDVPAATAKDETEADDPAEPAAKPAGGGEEEEDDEEMKPDAEPSKTDDEKMEDDPDADEADRPEAKPTEEDPDEEEASEPKPKAKTSDPEK